MPHIEDLSTLREVCLHSRVVLSLRGDTWSLSSTSAGGQHPFAAILGVVPTLPSPTTKGRSLVASRYFQFV